MEYGIATPSSTTLSNAAQSAAQESPRRLGVTICGSFRRDPAQLKEEYAALSFAGCAILSPTTLEWVGEQDGFVFASDEAGREPSEIEHGHLSAMRASHFVWLHAPQGYVGRSAAMELGYANALGLTVFARELPADVTLAGFVTRVASAAQAVARVRVSASPAPALGIDSLQRYYRRAAVARGWDGESVDECLRLLSGELDELAAAVHVDGASSSAAVLEMADVQLYLVHLANIAGVDLGDAIVEKERINAARFGPAVPRAA